MLFPIYFTFVYFILLPRQVEKHIKDTAQAQQQREQQQQQTQKGGELQ